MRAGLHLLGAVHHLELKSMARRWSDIGICVAGVRLFIRAWLCDRLT